MNEAPVNGTCRPENGSAYQARGDNTAQQLQSKRAHRQAILQAITPPLPVSLLKRVEERDGTNSWQHKVLGFLLKEWFQWFLVALLLIDGRFLSALIAQEYRDV
jgi:hypothetical protein